MRDRIFLAVFLLGVLSIPAIDATYFAMGWKLPDRPLRKTVKNVELPREFWNGRAMVKAEHFQMNHSFVARSVVGLHNELVFRVLGRYAPTTRVGPDRWLSSNADSTELSRADASRLVQENTDVLVAVNDFVRQSGGQLVIALVPDRSRLYPENVYLRGEHPPVRTGYLKTLAKALRDSGVVALDLTDALLASKSMGTAVYYSDDHHWTTAGAAAAVNEIAALVTTDYLPNRYRERQFEATMQPNSKSEGSLLKRLGFRPGSKLERRFRDHQPRMRFSPKRAVKWEDACATYWTTSFGRFGSPQLFANAIGCPVRVRLGNGKGSGFGPAKDLAKLQEELRRWRRRHANRTHLIVWEIPEYHTIATAAPPSFHKAVYRALRDAEGARQRRSEQSDKGSK